MMRWTHELLTRCLRRLAQSACLLCVCVATLLSVGSTAMAQDRIDATVVSVSGRSVYINAGRDAGVLSGARVVFRLKSGTLVEATIADVSANNARAELTEDSLVPSPDDHATVEVETPATNPPAGTAPTPTVPRAVPEHPPWQQTEGARKPDTPLLSPAFGSRPEDQPMVVKGRTYSTMRVIRDLEHDSDYIFARTGLWLDIRNPMRDGGRLRFQGDTDYRSSSTDFDSESETQARVQRFSYAWGLDKDAPFRGEVGRFYSSYLPELGTVDGIEGALRLENGWSLGAGGGLYPTTTQDLVDSDDMGFHLFADYQSDGTARAFQGTIGFQQTFYQGEADRSLVLGRIIANPSDDIRVFGLVMIDLYGSDEIIKSSSAEVTQLVAQASFRLSPTSGAIASVIHTTWPELKREEYVTLPEALIADGYVDRLSASWWTKLSKAWRVSLRSHYWQDQNGDGFGGEASVDWSLPTASPSSLYASVYHEESAYTTGDGLRAQVQTQLGSARLFVGYDGFAYSTDTATTDDNFYLRHTLRADVGWGEGQWYWDVDASYTLGDLEQSVTIGLTVQYRF